MSSQIKFKRPANGAKSQRGQCSADSYSHVEAQAEIGNQVKLFETENTSKICISQTSALSPR